MENQNGKGVVYGVISVCTLIVAIIGATFAYFTANSKDENTVYGAAGSTSVSLAVTRVTRDALYDVKEDAVEAPSEEGETVHRGYGYLLPVTDTEINTAVAGAVQTPAGQTEPQGEPVSCIDAKGNAACQVYKIEVTNSGNAPVSLVGKLEITPAGDAELKNLKWAKSDSATSGFTGAYAATTVVEPAQTAVTDLLDPAAGSGTVTLDAGDSKTMYIVLWISETGEAQDEDDHGSFTGVVSFNSSGTGVTSTFSTNV